MKQLELVKMDFKSPLHLAKGKPTYESSHEIFHSDSLKAAIFVAALQLGHEVTKGQGNNQSPFLDSFCVSSAFPYFGQEYFFPKPLSAFHNIEGDTRSIHFNPQKTKKKVKFLGKSFFEEVLNGPDAKGDFTRLIKKEHLLNGQQFVSDQISQTQLDKKEVIENSYLMASEVMQRVTIPRFYGDQESEPFYMERIFFPDKGGLYFFIEFKKEDAPLRKILEQSLELLGEHGVGSDRNTGHGQFEPTWNSMNLHVPTIASHSVSLSLFCPNDTIRNKEILDNSAFRLVKRGGFLSSPANEAEHTTYRKKSVYMLEEGAVLPNHNDSLFEGKLLDLQPDVLKNAHPVWRHFVHIKNTRRNYGYACVFCLA